MSKILVTGVNGFVGQHVAHELHKNGNTVIGIGGAHGSSTVHPEISDYFVLDLRVKSEAEKIPFESIDAIIHLAGLAAVGPSFDNPLDYINTNIGIEINLFEAALAQKVTPRFLVISSGSLFDPKASLPLNEESEIIPNSPYAVSKLGQEQMGRYYSFRGFEVLVARPFNHIGPGQNTGFLVPDLTKQVIGFEKGEVKKISVGNLDAQRDYTDVRDIARAYRLLLEKGLSGHTYNICSGHPVSGHDILAKILEVADVQPEIVQDPTKMRPSDAPVIYGTHDKITEHTGWQPEIKLEQTIADVVTDWRARFTGQKV
jgi:GDP-4-dehydro-6-deoxy-D-mannose reductase